MNAKYNNMMLCVIIIICLILGISFGYHTMEHFSADLIVYENKNQLLHRLVNDPDVKRHLIKQYKNVNRESDTQIRANLENIDAVSLAHDKMELLATKINNLTKKYNKDKIILDQNILNKLDASADNDIFNRKNIEIKNKVKLYQDNIELIRTKFNSKVKILKNNFTNKELSINEVSKDNNGNILYLLVVNNGCLNMMSKGNYKIDTCIPSNYKQLFRLKKINNYLEYNNNIKMGEQNNSTVYAKQDDVIVYPFYILQPYTIPGHCITYKKSNLSVRPINNDIYQRFSIRTVSTAC